MHAAIAALMLFHLSTNFQCVTCSRLQYHGAELGVLAVPAVCIIYSADRSEYYVFAE